MVAGKAADAVGAGVAEELAAAEPVEATTLNSPTTPTMGLTFGRSPDLLAMLTGTLFKERVEHTLGVNAAEGGLLQVAEAKAHAAGVVVAGDATFQRLPPIGQSPTMEKEQDAEAAVLKMALASEEEHTRDSYVVPHRRYAGYSNDDRDTTLHVR